MNKIDELLLRAKISPSKKGFYELKEVLSFMLSDETYTGDGICKFYDMVARKHNTHFSAVQKNISRVTENAIKSLKAADHIDPEFRWVTQRGELRPSEFVAGLVLMLNG